VNATVAVSAPLTGIQVVVTRAEESGGPLTRELARRGADVLHWPVLRFEPPEDVSSLRDALARLADYDGVVFTSPRAVDAVTSRVSP
jgi:uroporphyrinogen-III synthase